MGDYLSSCVARTAGDGWNGIARSAHWNWSSSWRNARFSSLSSSITPMGQPFALVTRISMPWAGRTAGFNLNTLVSWPLRSSITARLAATLADTKRTSLRYIFADEFGRALNYDQLQKKVMTVRKAAGLTEYSLPGLRYSAAGELAEAGCTNQQIAATTGHKSLSMVQKYSKGASQKRLAKEAQDLRERNKKQIVNVGNFSGNPKTTASRRSCQLAAKLLILWRGDRDSNPGNALTFNGFQDRRIRPLCHLPGPISGLGRKTG